MQYFPIFTDLDGAPVLMAGGGEQAAQKLRLLVKTGAQISVVAETVNREIETLAGRGVVRLLRRAFEAADVRGKRLAYAATGDRSLDARISEAARALGIPVNVVDAPELSTFITPAIVDRAPVTVAIGTEGAAPVLARQIRARIEALLPARLGALASRAQALRRRLARAEPDARRRRRLWERLLQGPFRDAVLEGADAQAERILANELEVGARQRGGRVALIGCGPGDPDLLTLKALQRLQEADVLVVDRLVDPRILDYARRDAERILVGKTPGGPSTSQAEINRILVREAKAGKVVARLKGGDPLVFGRAAEEMAALQAAGIPIEVVPGVTAALACAARVALPVTLREHVRQFSVVTGATADAALPGLDWTALAAPGAAFAVYMGVGNAPLIRANLLAAGAAAATPVVIVESGTRAGERAVATTLRDLTECVAQLGLDAPAVILVGLDWADAGLEPPEAVTVFERRQASALRGAEERPTRRTGSAPFRRPSRISDHGSEPGLTLHPPTPHPPTKVHP
jgi:uroporphyrin-III C-methyltransferase/precorrin-2 dehydrogenase/sirohydrochlorin ferrochelatase